MDSCVSILRINFSKLTLKETVKLIATKVSEDNNKIFHLITANPEIAVQIQDDPELKRISLEADLITQPSRKEGQKKLKAFAYRVFIEAIHKCIT